jgi:hypothetical protein
MKTFHIYVVPTFHQVWEVEAESEEAVKEMIEEAPDGCVPQDAVMVGEEYIDCADTILDYKEVCSNCGKCNFYAGPRFPGYARCRRRPGRATPSRDLGGPIKAG